LVLIAVAWGQRRLWWRCGLTLIFAALLHPFTALAGVGVCYAIAAQRHRRLWLLVPIGAFAFAGFAAFGIQPFTHIRSTVGGVWWTVVAGQTAYAFVSRWYASDIARLASQGLIFALAYHRVASSDERRLMRATALVAVAGVLATLVGGDWLHDELFVEVPFYRTLWLWTVLTNALAGLLIWRMREERPYIRAALIVGVGTYALDAWFPVLMPFVAVPVLATLFVVIWRRPSGQELTASDKVALGAISALAALSAIVLVAVINLRLVDATRPGGLDELLINVCLLTLALLAVVRLARKGLKKTAAALLAGTLVSQIVIYGIGALEAIRFLESYSKLPARVATLVDRSANVYWEDGVAQQWFALKRPAYFSREQGGGVAFNEHTALEYYRRAVALRKLNTDDFVNDPRDFAPYLTKADTLAVGPTSRAQLASACRALPDLDLMVLYARIPGAYSAEWPLPRTVYLGNPRRMFDHDYLYECRTLR
jgi:hypothetical protein